MLAQRQAGVTLVVAHRGVIRAITRILTGAEPVIELGSIQVLACGSGDRWVPERLDFMAHLAEVK
jgi:broad specificity phosphatase PhoE